MLTEEDSLTGRVFKGIYYPRTTTVDNKYGYAPNYARRSILSAMELVSIGVRWRIGNGDKVRIWGDSWLLENVGFTAFSSINVLD